MENKTFQKIEQQIPPVDEYYLTILLQTMKKWYSTSREGSHVLDTILCPRQRIFKILYPTSVTAKELNMYSSGRAIHEAIQILFMSNRGRFEPSVIN